MLFCRKANAVFSLYTWLSHPRFTFVDLARFGLNLTEFALNKSFAAQLSVGAHVLTTLWGYYSFSISLRDRKSEQQLMPCFHARHATTRS